MSYVSVGSIASPAHRGWQKCLDDEGKQVGAAAAMDRWEKIGESQVIEKSSWAGKLRIFSCLAPKGK